MDRVSASCVSSISGTLLYRLYTVHRQLYIAQASFGHVAQKKIQTYIGTISLTERWSPYVVSTVIAYSLHGQSVLMTATDICCQASFF